MITLMHCRWQCTCRWNPGSIHYSNNSMESTTIAVCESKEETSVKLEEEEETLRCDEFLPRPSSVPFEEQERFLEKRQREEELVKCSKRVKLEKDQFIVACLSGDTHITKLRAHMDQIHMANMDFMVFALAENKWNYAIENSGRRAAKEEFVEEICKLGKLYDEELYNSAGLGLVKYL